MAEPVRITVTGLNEFVKNLKTIDRDLGKMVRLAFNEAADLVVDEARPRVPRRSGRARGSVKVRSTQTRARVSGGGNKAPYYPWLDFGGTVGKGKRGKGTGPIRRPFIQTEGRYIYKSYFDLYSSGRVEDVMVKALLNVVESAGIEVT